MRYLVEMMKGEEVVASKEVRASSPYVAASMLARGSIVHFDIDRSDWIQVTPHGQPALEFGHDRLFGEDVKPRRPLRKAKRR